MPNPCWRHHDRDPLSKVDRIRKEDGNFVKVMKDGTTTPTISNQIVQGQIDDGKLVRCEDVPLPTIADEELTLSMFAFMEQHGGERMIRATAQACQMIADRSDKELDGTSRDVWNQAATIINKAAEILEG